MPIITAFQGTITVEGRSKPSKPVVTLYSNKVTCYGETIGELLDNLVAASVTIANDLFTWAATNKPEGYEFGIDGDDFWYMHIKHPDILEASICDPKTHDKDTGSSSTLHGVDYAVSFTTLIRNLQIRQTASYLLLLQSKGEPSAIIDKAIVPYDNISNVTSFNEMAKCGFTGAELDMILETGEKEGRIKQYLDTMELIRGSRLSNSGHLPEESKKSNWWSRLKANIM